jgi:hypothetical protein
MSDSDTTTFSELLASSMAKAVKSAKKLGYSGTAFSSMASIAWSSYVAGEQDTKKNEEKKA